MRACVCNYIEEIHLSHAALANGKLSKIVNIKHI